MFWTPNTGQRKGLPDVVMSDFCRRPLFHLRAAEHLMIGDDQSDWYDNLGVTSITYIYIYMYIHHPYGYIVWLYGNNIIHVGIDPYRLT